MLYEVITGRAEDLGRLEGIRCRIGDAGRHGGRAQERRRRQRRRASRVQENGHGRMRRLSQDVPPVEALAPIPASVP